MAPPTDSTVAGAQAAADAMQATAANLQAAADAAKSSAQQKAEQAAASGDPQEMAEATAAAAEAAQLQHQADQAQAQADQLQAVADDLAVQQAVAESSPPPTSSSTPSPTSTSSPSPTSSPTSPPAPPPPTSGPTVPAPTAPPATEPVPGTTAPPPSTAAPASMQHARLLVLEAKVAGKSATVGAQVDEVGFSINPKELQLTSSAEWKSKPAKKPQPAEYTGLKPTNLQFEVLFDAAVHAGPIGTDVRKLLHLVRPLEVSKATNPRPPFVQLCWGEMVSRIYIVKQVQAKYTRFGTDGVPIRATVTLQLEEAMIEPPKQNPTSGGPAGRRVHVAVAGDTLASIATAEYGEPRFWRSIAASNGIDDPMRLQPGTRLLLPKPDDLPVRP